MEGWCSLNTPGLSNQETREDQSGTSGEEGSALLSMKSKSTVPMYLY